ncbi:hypothetical protein [Streptomyces rimosus]|uniref:hypothetical protein n=1 Tax=Streptomyces rimosus TaxID=1927 RepID=UPI0004C50D03|nr:hypothetical protein [Streptomyces rimosus]
MTDILLPDLAQAAADLVISRLDEKYVLVHIERGDCLTDEQIRKLFAGEEALDLDWWDENRWQGVKYVLHDLLDQNARDFLEEHDVLDRIVQAIEERDESDPISELMRGTGSKLFRYRLDAEAAPDPWRFSEKETEDAARTLGTAAGIDFWDNVGALRELVAHASYGGDLYVLWRGDIKPVYEAVRKLSWTEAPEITVQWTDPELLVLDQLNGSGHSVRVRGSLRLPFNPDRLFIDTARGPGGYSWTDVVGSGYLPEGDEPEFIETSKEESQRG